MAIKSASKVRADDPTADSKNPRTDVDTAPTTTDTSEPSKAPKDPSVVKVKADDPLPAS